MMHFAQGHLQHPRYAAWVTSRPDRVKLMVAIRAATERIRHGQTHGHDARDSRLNIKISLYDIWIERTDSRRIKGYEGVDRMTVMLAGILLASL